MYELIKNTGQASPDLKFQLGHAKNGSTSVFAVIINTPYGSLPGKGKRGEAWYSYGGKEYYVKGSEFQWLRCRPGFKVEIVKSMTVPAGAVTGHQNNIGPVYSVICHKTGNGKIPGKSDGRQAWWSWGGHEYSTSDFSYVVVLPDQSHGGHHPHPQPHHGGGHHVPAPHHPVHHHPVPHHGGQYPPPAPVPHHYPTPPPAPVPQPVYIPPQPSDHIHHIPTPSFPGYTPRPLPAGHFHPTPMPAPPQGLAEGMTVRFRSKTGKNLRVKSDGVVDGMGVNGLWATFRVHVVGPGRYSFQNQQGAYMAVKSGRPTLSQKFNDPDATFMVHLNADQSVSFESQTNPGMYLGIRRKTGACKLTRAGKPSSRYYTQVV